MQRRSLSMQMRVALQHCQAERFAKSGKCCDLQTRDDAWLRGVKKEAAARGYSPRLVLVVGKLLSMLPDERGTAADLLECLADAQQSLRFCDLHQYMLSAGTGIPHLL